MCDLALVNMLQFDVWIGVYSTLIHVAIIADIVILPGRKKCVAGLWRSWFCNCGIIHINCEICCNIALVNTYSAIILGGYLLARLVHVLVPAVN